MKAGTNLGGIRCLADLRDRCRIDTFSGCWLWALGVTHDGQPKVEAVIEGRRTKTTGGRVAWMFAKGAIPSGRVVYRARGCPKLCLNPAHLSCGTKAEAGAFLQRSGHLRGYPERSIINLRNRCSRGVVLDLAKAREIRASDEPNMVLAARWGVSKTTIQDIRAMRRWIEPG